MASPNPIPVFHPADNLFFEDLHETPGVVQQAKERDCYLVSHGVDVTQTARPLALSNLRLAHHPSSSPFRCRYCGDHFDVAPWCIYHKKNKNGTWTVSSNFCMVGCMMRYLSTLKDTGITNEWKVNGAIVARQRLNIPITRPVPIAPPIETRIDYGGALSIEEFREAGGYGMKLAKYDSVTHYCHGPFIYGSTAACTTTTRGESRVNDSRSILKWITTFSDPNDAEEVVTIDPSPAEGQYSTREVSPVLVAPSLNTAAPSQAYMKMAEGEEEAKGAVGMAPTPVHTPAQRGEDIMQQVMNTQGAEIQQAAARVAEERGGPDTATWKLVDGAPPAVPSEQQTYKHLKVSDFFG